jgi:hypothetical protein
MAVIGATLGRGAGVNSDAPSDTGLQGTARAGAAAAEMKNRKVRDRILTSIVENPIPGSAS